MDERWREKAGEIAAHAEYFEPLRDAIATALQAACNEGLERAADAVDRIGPRVTGDTIRALKDQP